MKIKNLLEEPVHASVLERINKLTPATPGFWGKMTVSQMLAHCKEAFKVPLSEKPLPRLFMGRMMGWMFKKQLYNEKEWKQNLPTASNFKIKDKRDFATEKNELIQLINQFFEAGPQGIGKSPHPMFGEYTSEQWGLSMWKHIDHHLRQFGV
ncbi:MAG TPA: DUF1569 domain-containing protein [Chitinophagaceae bacterium]|nr:DUF1569 domain-containing protein [Chitinophagaceae bacterium]HQV05314.1 DUF1569 domain-containing protein [Chitinophagaceae bacterium]